MMIQSNQTLVFIGDSITDAFRDYGDPEDLGIGYVKLLTTFLNLKYPYLQIKTYNRGINGHRLIDMKQRWQENCLALNPDIISILIGINDIWSHHYAGLPMLPNFWKNFYETYNQLIEETKLKTDAQLVLVKVFALPYPQDRQTWQEDIFLMNQLIDRLAEKHQCMTVDLHSRLMALGREYGYALYTGNDGVHPTALGHGVIAQAWLQSMGAF